MIEFTLQDMMFREAVWFLLPDPPRTIPEPPPVLTPDEEQVMKERMAYFLEHDD
jgi:hypothetical protein